MRWAGLVAVALCLGACAPLALAEDAISIRLSVAAADASRLDAKLTPAQLKLRPGESATLQLEVKSSDPATRTITVDPQVTGPSDGLTVTVASAITVPHGTSRAPVGIVALPGIVPGRYELAIRLNTP